VSEKQTLRRSGQRDIYLRCSVERSHEEVEAALFEHRLEEWVEILKPIGIFA